MKNDKRERALALLSAKQLSDGSFGRFHTRDTKVKQSTPTTEAAAWLMYENGIDRRDEVCEKTCAYMERLLSELSGFPDLWEKNRIFAPGVPLFIASKLALFSSSSEKYIEIRNIWISILIAAFESGEYSSAAVDDKSVELLGTPIDGTCIGLHGLNNLALYAHNTELIPASIQKAYLRWLHGYEGRIAYTTVIPSKLIDDKKSARVISLLKRFDGFDEEFCELTQRL